MSATPPWQILAELGLRPDQTGLWTDEEHAAAVVPVPSGGYLVGWLDVEWPHPSEPFLRMRSIEHVPSGKLRPALRRSLAKRERRMATCGRCGRRLPPGKMHSEDCCQRCAETHLGVVY
jgi:hypothetical protein